MKFSGKTSQESPPSYSEDANPADDGITGLRVARSAGAIPVLLINGNVSEKANEFPTGRSTMSQKDQTQTGWISALPSLVVPVCIGLSLYVGMLALIRHGYLENEMALRYLTGHPVSKISVAMFLIGGVSLALIAVNVMAQFRGEQKLFFTPLADDTYADPNSLDGQHEVDDADRAVQLGQQLLDQLSSTHTHYLWQRLTNALLFVYRTGSAAGVDNEVKYLAELDFDRQQQRYSLARILIWATPMLGFLGTVLGISQALGGISVGPDNDFQAMMDGLQSSLYVAFDTTALALTLSMVLMFAQFLVERFETQLLALVDQRARSEMASQFEAYGQTADAATAVEQLGQHLVNATQQMMVAQTDVWKQSIHAAEQAWASSAEQTNEQVRASLVESIQQTTHQLSEGLDGSITRANESMVRRWEQWQVMLSDNARLMNQHQQELVAQTQSLHDLTKHTHDSEGAKQQANANAAAKAEVNHALAATTQAIVATKDLKAAIAGLTEKVQQLGSVGETKDHKVNSQQAAAATDRRRARQRVLVNRRADQSSDNDVGVSRRKPTMPIDSFANVSIPAAKQGGKNANVREEVLLPIKPYLTGEKSVTRKNPALTDNVRARRIANRKAA